MLLSYQKNMHLSVFRIFTNVTEEDFEDVLRSDVVEDMGVTDELESIRVSHLNQKLNWITDQPSIVIRYNRSDYI